MNWQDECDLLWLQYAGYDLVASRYFPEGEVYMIENKIVFGTGPKSEDQKRKDNLRKEIRKQWWSEPKMRKWYEFIGEDWSHL